ncbi:MAG: hypothetical protein COA42_00490 [Alteromonadaceae bacterium]|nr:MAG: hypothetical protein COA42_00490 [Alteromonadaceae bacterium]
MRKSYQYFKHFTIGLLLLATNLSGHAQTPTSAQIEQFRKLPRAQQEALAKQYGIELPGEAQGQTSSPVSEPVVVVPKESQNEKPAGNVEEQFQQSANSLEIQDEKKETRVVKQILKQFGYDLFAGKPTTFAPATDIPIPTDYIMGPGDSVKIRLSGKKNVLYEQRVNRDGTLDLQDLGTISVVGLSFDDMRRLISTEYKEKAIGISSSVTLGALRSIRIFMLGAVNNPGAYTVSSLSTLTNALFVGGGISKLGSLRNIQLKRQGKLITTFDLYDLLLKGDISADRRLLPSDVIFVPTIGSTAGIKGEVHRPAIYELKQDETINDLIKMSGGLLSTAYPSVSRIERIQKNGDRIVIDADLSQVKVRNGISFDGDVIEIFSILDRVRNSIELSGHLERPGIYSWRKNIRVSDIIGSIDELLPKADLNYALIVRETAPNRETVVKSFNLGEALTNLNSDQNLKLEAHDKILIFGIETSRATLLSDTVGKLIDQERADNPPKVVTVIGNVRHPGTYPMSSNMSVSDLLKASLEAKADTDKNYAVIERTSPSKSRYEAITISLDSAKWQNYILQELDKLYVFDLTDNRAPILKELVKKLNAQADKNVSADTVSIHGSVKHPGTYPLSRSMTARQLVLAAGGLKNSAYTETAEVSRFSSNLSTQASQEIITIALDDQLNGISQFVLRAKDTLSIKQIPDWSESQFVHLKGEFVFPGRYYFKEGDTLSKIIERAGGFTKQANPKAVQFLRASLAKKENAQIELLKSKLKMDIASKSIENSAVVNSLDIDKIYELLDTRQLKGRLSIDVEKVISEPSYDIVLRDADTVIAPMRIQEVTVIGQVHSQMSHLFIPGKSMTHYIDKSGGITQSALRSQIYVVKANGEVIRKRSNLWFSKHASSRVEAGDTIVVPMNAHRVNKLQLWTSISQVIYQFGLAAAAVSSF